MLRRSWEGLLLMYLVSTIPTECLLPTEGTQRNGIAYLFYRRQPSRSIGPGKISEVFLSTKTCIGTLILTLDYQKMMFCSHRTKKSPFIQKQILLLEEDFKEVILKENICYNLYVCSVLRKNIRL